jgi:sugar/nucleoside kinase (ribokinase family)
MTASVVVVGDLMVDVVVVPDGPLARGSDTPAEVVSLGGGSAANTACWLASLGIDVALVASVGDDAIGRAALDALDASGVEFAGCIDGERPTGSCVVLVEPGGERTMLPDRGANDALDPAATARAIGGGTGWVHLSGYALLGEGSHAAAQTAMAAARRHALPWSIDAASAAPLRASGPSRFLGWIDGCRLLFANDEEVDALGGLAATLDSASEVVVKLGAAGASWTDGSRSETSPANPVDIVDTIGAGDAFDAGFLAARLRGDDAGACLHAGALAAAQAVGQRGARPSP